MSTSTAKAFKQVLARKGLIGRESGIAIVHGIDGEDSLLTKWQAVAGSFVHKTRRVRVGMGFERLHFNESRVWPVVTVI